MESVNTKNKENNSYKLILPGKISRSLNNLSKVKVSTNNPNVVWLQKINREDMFTLTKIIFFNIKSRAEIFLNIWNGPTKTTWKLALKLGMDSAVNTDHVRIL